MKFEVKNKIGIRKGILLVPVFEDNLKKLPGDFPEIVKNFIAGRVKNENFEGKKDNLLFTYLHGENLPEKLVIFGCGKIKEFDGKLSRELGGKIGKFIQKHHTSEAAMLNPVPHLPEFLQGLKMVQYDIGRFKTAKKPEEKNVTLQKLEIVTGKKSKDMENGLKEVDILAEAIDNIRDLVNGPSNIVDGEHLCDEAGKIARENGYKLTIYKNKELKKMGAGGILAVHQGAKKDAYLIVLEYRGGKKGESPIALIGKGVIFDTGGYNLKPVNHIEDMQQDMAGGATVLGVFSVLKKLGIKKNIVGIIPTVENLVSDTAYRPSDIITMLSGKTVEITNTDAEGRMILADAITHGATFKPKFMLTIATLTGAVAAATGDRYYGLLGNDNELIAKLRRAGDEVDDLGWPLPLHEDYKKKMDSEIADLRNYDNGSGKFAGSSKGAAFLERFVEGNKWAHIDIGGTAFTGDPKEYETKGATASGFRMLVRFFTK
ncbi:leucyl aminopeptidase [Candidatus Peregrinibacteria bacterium]|nr:leucyl aminopeptidase [Candidatus Peregrinibacteria bacterium]